MKVTMMQMYKITNKNGFHHWVAAKNTEHALEVASAQWPELRTDSLVTISESYRIAVEIQ